MSQLHFAPFLGLCCIEDFDPWSEFVLAAVFWLTLNPLWDLRAGLMCSNRYSHYITLQLVYLV